jgi:hypothetical protein
MYFMKIVSVTAPCNGSGKTSLILSILQAFPGIFSAIKFTTIYREEQFCPVGDHECACHKLQGQYVICSDPQVLSQPNTDTGKIWTAGARQTLWCVSRQEGYPDMLQELFASHLNNETHLLIEGNTAIRHLLPDLRLFVVNPFLPPSWWKSDVDVLLEDADLVIVNPYASGTQSSENGVHPSVHAALDRVKPKKIEMENVSRLDLWQDRRIYQAISARLVD